MKKTNEKNNIKNTSNQPQEESGSAVFSQHNKTEKPKNLISLISRLIIMRSRKNSKEKEKKEEKHIDENPQYEIHNDVLSKKLPTTEIEKEPKKTFIGIPTKKGTKWINVKKYYKRKNKNTAQKVIYGIGVPAILALGITAGTMLYFEIENQKLNKTLPAGQPFSPEDVVDKNGNNFEFDDNGQIIFDSMSDQERQLLGQALNERLVEDAKRMGANIDYVKEILSINLIPCDMTQSESEDETNAIRYIMSILLKDGNDMIYAQNYYTSNSFTSDSATTKEKIADFINFIKACSRKNSSVMSASGQQIMYYLDDENIIYVGDSFYGYLSSGDECECIPIYNSDGTGYILYALSDTLEGYGVTLPSVILRRVDADNVTIFKENFATDDTINNMFKILKNDISTKPQNENELEK